MLPINQQLSEDQGPQTGVFEAAYELASMDTFVAGSSRDTILGEGNALGAIFGEGDISSGKKLDPKDLNERFKDVEVPFNKPMSEVAAFHLNEEGRKRRELQQKISDGPNGTFYNQAVNIGANLVAHALDPVEFGAGALTGLGIRGAGMLIKGSKAAATFPGIEKFGEALTKSGFAVESGEGILGNALLEYSMYGQQNRAQVDYGIEDSFISVVGGGFAMPVLKKAFSSVIGLPNSTVGLAAKSSIGQALEGYRPTPELHAKAYNDIAYKNSPEGVPMGSVRSEYRFEPMDPALSKDKVFYMTGASINESKTVGEFLGDGAYMTDNPNFANNLAAHPMDDSVNDIFEVKLNETNLLDLDKPLSTEIAESLDIKTLEMGQDAKAVFDSWSPEFKESFIAKMKELGYDGFSRADVEKGHNSVHLFPESIAKIQEQGRFKPDIKAVPTLDPMELEAMRSKARSRENELGFDPALDKEFSEFVLPDEFKSVESARIEAEMDDTLKRLSSMDKEGFLSAESKATLEQIKQSKFERASRLEVLKDFTACLLSGV